MRIAFALEHSLGHVTHAQNLKRIVGADAAILPTYIDLDYHDRSSWDRLPGIGSNWSIRASLGAYRALRPKVRDLDAALFHTQVTSLFSVGLMRRLPSVISLDATPVQYDSLGAAYGHVPSGSAAVEQLKKRLNQQAFRSAKRLVTWSQWAKDSLIADYQIPKDKIVVIPPGIDTGGQWNFEARLHRGPVRLLFVGGDFNRKGGDTLLRAVTDLPRSLNVHLDIVTAAGVAQSGPGVTVHTGVTPNSDKLRHLFAQADLFVFPTRGDCLPLAVMEALAAGLPVITTSVGALPEAVRHRVTGWIVPPDDPSALSAALLTLAANETLRAQMSERARQTAVEQFDAATNYGRLVETVKSVARHSTAPGMISQPPPQPS